MQGRTDRPLPLEEQAMHPDIMKALMTEHVRELRVSARAARRSRKGRER